MEIWRDYHRETLRQPVCPRLPEPPDQREMLKAEIKFFVRSIQEKAKAHGRFVLHLMVHLFFSLENFCCQENVCISTTFDLCVTGQFFQSLLQIMWTSNGLQNGTLGDSCCPTFTGQMLFLLFSQLCGNTEE